jgi:hypothetical protein
MTGEHLEHDTADVRAGCQETHDVPEDPHRRLYRVEQEPEEGKERSLHQPGCCPEQQIGGELQAQEEVRVRHEGGGRWCQTEAHELGLVQGRDHHLVDHRGRKVEDECGEDEDVVGEELAVRAELIPGSKGCESRSKDDSYPHDHLWTG